MLLHGLRITDLEVCENGFSDHKTVMFTVSCSAAAPSVSFCGRLSLLITHTTKDSFLSIFHEVMPSIVDFSCDASVEELLSKFNPTCSNVLNAVAPFRTLQSKIRSEPWIDDSIRSLRRCFRRAERKWKKDKLHVSFEILRTLYLNIRKQ